MTRKTLAIAGATAVVVVGGGAALASAAQLFSSPKQILMNVASRISSTSTKSQSVNATFNAKISGIGVLDSVPAPQQKLITGLNGTSISGSIIVHLKQKEGQASFKINRPSQGSFPVKLWLESNKVVLSASSLQPLLSSYLHSTGIPTNVQIPTMPKYLVTGPSAAPLISRYWQTLQNSSMTPEKAKADGDLIRLIVSGIPSQFITRPSLNKIRVKIDSSSLQAIGDSEITMIFKHKKEVADDLNTLYGTQVPVNQVFTVSESQARQILDSTISRLPITVENATLELSKPIFGGGSPTSKVKVRMSLNPSFTGGLSGKYTVSETLHMNDKSTMSLPNPDSQNSMTFKQFSTSR